MNVSRETEAKLDEYVSLVRAWNRRINLVGSSEESEFRDRHVDDCRQLVSLIPEGAREVADLGTGAGLPGLVIAICRPDLRVVCVESDRRKASFVAHTIRILSLNAEVRTGRIEASAPLSAGVVTARALAPLPKLLGYVHPHLHPNGTALLMKGRRWQEELENARASWQFCCEAASSRTGPNAVILSIGGLRPCLT